MEFRLEELTKLKPFIAIPCQGGKMEAETAQGLLGFQALSYAAGIKNEISFLTNEALIPRARNQLVAEFMSTDCTHLFFIDADQGFEGVDIFKLMARRKEVVAGLCPKKCIPTSYACSFIAEDGKAVRDGELIELNHAGTGFLCIERSVIERLIAANPDLKYDNVYTKKFEVNNKGLDIEKLKKYTYSLFDTVQEGNSYYGEDNAFCKRWKDLGGRIWGDTTVDITHIGRFTFMGNLSALEGI